MAYDLELAERIRELVAGEDGVTEQRMFGGLSFLVNGNMSVAIPGPGGLMVRMRPEEAAQLVDDQGVRPMEMGGREIRGWLLVSVTAESSELEQWVARGVGFAKSLPAKDSTKKSGRRSRRDQS